MALSTEKSVSIQFRALRKWRDELKIYCEEKNISMSDFIRAAVEEKIEREN